MRRAREVVAEGMGFICGTVPELWRFIPQSHWSGYIFSWGRRLLDTAIM